MYNYISMNIPYTVYKIEVFLNKSLKHRYVKFEQMVKSYHVLKVSKH